MLKTLSCLITLAASPAGQGPSPEPLRIAWQFASAIASDEVDRGSAQEAVVQDLAEAGLLDEATRLARDVAGWRRGTALADLAARLARKGRTAEAQARIDEARGVQARINGWQERRIEMHVMAALAALGQADAAAAAVADLAKQDSQYEGRPEAIAAPILAGQGRVAEALQALAALDGARGIDATIARTQGYLEVARVDRLDAASRLDVLFRAERSAGGIPGWPQIESLVQVARLQAELGDRTAALTTLRGAEPMLAALPPTLPTRARLLSRAAEAWAAAGDPARGRLLLEDAGTGVAAMPVIDQPAACGVLAGGHAALGHRAEAERLFGRSLDAAESLVNARPRALAVVEIAREMARSSWEIDPALRARFESLHRGLKDPW